MYPWGYICLSKEVHLRLAREVKKCMHIINFELFMHISLDIIIIIMIHLLQTRGSHHRHDQRKERVSALYQSVCICSTIGKHILAQNRHEIKCFIVQENTDRMCLEACLLHNIVISLVSKCHHHHPSMRHLATHQGISLGQKIVSSHCPEKHVMCNINFFGYTWFTHKQKTETVLGKSYF